jgi:hypothetical protein
VESGLLFMPQAVASLTVKLITGRLLNRIGFRGVLISNTVIIGRKRPMNPSSQPVRRSA